MEQEGEGIVGDISLKAFRVLANGVRKFIKGARPLEDGELHFLGANFLGPGTKIDKPRYRNMKPLNRPDAVARQHDLDYYEAINNKDISKKERMELIRKADNKMIKALKDMGKLEGTAELYRQAGLKGIQFKRKVENVSPALVKLLLPDDIVGKKKNKKELEAMKKKKEKKSSDKAEQIKKEVLDKQKEVLDKPIDLVPKKDDKNKPTKEQAEEAKAKAKAKQSGGADALPQAVGRAGNPIFAQFTKIKFPVRRDFQLQSGGTMRDKIMYMRGKRYRMM